MLGCNAKVTYDRETRYCVRKKGHKGGHIYYYRYR